MDTLTSQVSGLAAHPREMPGIRRRRLGAMLAGVLAENPRPVTLVLQEMGHCTLSPTVLTSGTRPLHDRERTRLDAEGSCRFRHVLLVTGTGVVAMSATFAWLPNRLTDHPEAIDALDEGKLPAGVILNALPGGMQRTDCRAMASTGIEEVLGGDVATISSAVCVALGRPVAIAEEFITLAFAGKLTFS